jgi:hypothetical protein
VFHHLIKLIFALPFVPVEKVCTVGCSDFDLFFESIENRNPWIDALLNFSQCLKRVHFFILIPQNKDINPFINRS